MDPPTSLLHRCSGIPTPRQSRKRTDRRRTRKETDENPRDLNALSPNRATNIRRMGNFKLAKLDIPERSGGNRQDHHLDNDRDSTPPSNILLHRTLGMESNRTEKTPSRRLRRRNLSSSLELPALPSNNHRNRIHHPKP